MQTISLKVDTIASVEDNGLPFGKLGNGQLQGHTSPPQYAG